jgi:hypothetical protein
MDVNLVHSLNAKSQIDITNEIFPMDVKLEQYENVLLLIKVTKGILIKVKLEQQ